MGTLGRRHPFTGCKWLGYRRGEHAEIPTSAEISCPLLTVGSNRLPPCPAGQSDSGRLRKAITLDELVTQALERYLGIRNALPPSVATTKSVAI